MEAIMDRRTVTMGLALASLGAFTAEASAHSGAENPVIAAFAKTLSANDIDAFAALFADDYINHQTSAAAPKPAAGVTAKQATVGFFAGRLKGLPDLSVAIEASLASGDLAAASFVYTGTHKGVYFGVAPTEKPLRFTSCDIFRIRDGKIAEHWGMGDIAGILAQLKG
jgi:predicted ester cyclase